jgi:hypothetical protein
VRLDHVACCVCVCVRARVRACVCVCVGVGGRACGGASLYHAEVVQSGLDGDVLRLQSWARVLMTTFPMGRLALAAAVHRHPATAALLEFVSAHRAEPALAIGLEWRARG